MRSVAAVLAGFVTVFVLSLGTDQVLHVLQVYPPWGEPMHDPSLNALALAYRVPIGVLGGWVTAKLAPWSPMRHALVMGAIGLALSSLGALAAIRADLGPAWYPIALAASAVPCAWLGGALTQR
jgi:hypothetical protein